jgi:outer membrane protein TolC
LIFSSSAFSDSLNEWLDSLNEVNPKVRASYSRWQAAKAKTPQAGGYPDPMIGVDVERNSTKLNEYNDLEYMVEQPIPWPGRLGIEKEVAGLEAEAAGFEYLEARRNAEAQLVSSAWELWKLRQTIEALQENLQLTRQLEAVIRSGLEAGMSPQTDLLRVQIAVENIDNEIQTMKQSERAELARLNSLLNADPALPRSTENLPEIPALPESVEKVQAESRQFSCMLLAATLRKKARDRARESAKLESRPNLSFRVEARQFDETGTIDEIDTGIFMNVPWLWGGKYKGRRAEAEADRNMAQYDFEEVAAFVLAEIQEKYSEAESHHRAMKLYENTIVPRTRDLAASSRESYQSGKISAMELLDAQRMVQEALITWYGETAGFASANAELMSITSPWTPEEFDSGLPPNK